MEALSCPCELLRRILVWMGRHLLPTWTHTESFQDSNPLDLCRPGTAFSTNHSGCSDLSQTILLASGLTKPDFQMIFCRVDCPLIHLALSCSVKCFVTVNLQMCCDILNVLIVRNTSVGFCNLHLRKNNTWVSL